MIEVLKCKLNKVIVTSASMEYEGSITIDEDLMDAAGLKEYERVEVNGMTNPSRIVTYVIKGKRNTGVIEMNGGASLHFKKGDMVHVLCYHIVPEGKYTTTVVYTDNKNKITTLKRHEFQNQCM